MQNQEYSLLDTNKFNSFINARSSLLSEYERINQRFNSVVQNLTGNWQGQGADAFVQDAQKVRTNIGGIQDILRTMCDTLIDCRDVFQECDTSLGSANQAAGQVN